MATDNYRLTLDTTQAVQGLNRLKGAAAGFAAALALREVVQFGQAIINSTKEFQKYQNQLRLITSSEQELAATTALLRNEAVKNRAAFADTVDLYAKLTLSTKEMGASQEDVIKVTGKLSQALAVSGADAATSSSVIRQFGQAMASGTVRGDEFNSLVEGLGSTLSIMADETGIGVGKLREMSQAGELTAEVLFDMLKNSTALTAAFEGMVITIDQLETQLGTAFDAALVKIGSATGLTEAYEESVISLTRSLRLFSDTQTDLEKLSINELMGSDVAGPIAKLEELNLRFEHAYSLIDDIASFDMDTLWGQVQATGYAITLENIADRAGITVDQLKNMRTELQRQIEANAEATKLSEEAAAAEKARADALKAALAPFAESIKLAQIYAKTGYGSAVDKNAQALEKAKKALEDFNSEAIRNNMSLDEQMKLRMALNTQIEYLTENQKKLNKQMRGGGQLMSEFYTELLDNAQKTVIEARFTEQAIEKLNEEFADKSNLVYIAAMKELVPTLKTVKDNTQAIADNVSDFSTSLTDSLGDAQFEFDKLNMNELEGQLATIDRTLRTSLTKQIQELQRLSQEAGGTDISGEIAAITAKTEEVIKQRQALAKSTYDEQRSFSHGWKKAFEDYEDEATNAAKKAEEVFTSATKGMEDSIVGFAKTGKFEFKSLVSDILESLLRSQIQSLIASTFKMPFGSGGGSAGGGIGDFFGGFFANGGTLGAGKFGIAGEAGPELISGPATITPLTGGNSGNVTYNINAVDALSFRQLVARDPGFIHAVAMKGGSKVPQGR
tara:strand:+ start:1082 stop:3445 length:2364 start_codon:yes stop_codon:yes gene_type:complete